MGKRVLITADASRNKMIGVGTMAQKVCAEKGFTFDFDVLLLSQVKAEELDVDLIILFGTSQKLNTQIPIVSGVPFLTRIGMDRAADEIIAKLKG